MDNPYTTLRRITKIIESDYTKDEIKKLILGRHPNLFNNIAEEYKKHSCVRSIRFNKETWDVLEVLKSDYDGNRSMTIRNAIKTLHELKNK